MRSLLVFGRRTPVKPGTVLAILISVLVLAGCGGGGGGGCASGSVASTLTYETEWSGANGQSQVVQLLTEAGTVLQSRVVNRGVTQVTFNPVFSGVYRVRGDLRSASDGNGAILGRFDAGLSLCGTQTLRSRTGGSPTAVRIFPQSATLTVGGIQSFFATLVNSSGEHFFTPLGSIVWSSTGTGGSVDSLGTMTTTAPGTVTVRASEPGLGLSATATATVKALSAPRSKWTILVFMNAANDLNPYSVLNINQMERVAGNADVRFVVQWKQSRAVFPSSTFDGTRRLLVKADSSNAIASPTLQDLGLTVDMGDWSALRDFIQWGKTQFPSDRVGLIVWNHGNGWQRGIDPMTRAVSYDDQTGNSIQIWQLPLALTGHHFDFIAWDASLMQMMEVAYEIRAYTDFVIGSEESPPGEGYPYDEVFKPWRDNPNRTTVSLSKSFVDGMVNHAPYANRKITQSVVDTSRLGAVATAMDSWALALITHQSTVRPVVLDARANAQSYSPTFIRTYRDLWHVANFFDGNITMPPDVSSGAAAVKAAVAQAVVWEGHNANSPNSHGLAIDFSTSGNFTSMDSDYSRLQWAADTHWDNWLRIAP